MVPHSGAGVWRQVQLGRRVRSAGTTELFLSGFTSQRAKGDPAAWRKEFRNKLYFVQTVKEAIAPLGGQVRVFFMDEARFGQQGTTTRVWAATNSRPAAVRQTRYEWVYLYAAYRASDRRIGAAAGMNVNTGTFEAVKMLSKELQPLEHAVLIMDQAGWHRSKRLKMPDNITALLLPPYSPELNPAENLWHYLRSHYWRTVHCRDYDHLLDAGTQAYRSLTSEIVKSVCRSDYINQKPRGVIAIHPVDVSSILQITCGHSIKLAYASKNPGKV